MLVTLARSKATSSASARLVPWTMLPSMQRRRPSGLMISLQSCATVNLRAYTLPVRRSISTSVMIVVGGFGFAWPSATRSLLSLRFQLIGRSK